MRLRTAAVSVVAMILTSCGTGAPADVSLRWLTPATPLTHDQLSAAIAIMNARLQQLGDGTSLKIDGSRIRAELSASDLSDVPAALLAQGDLQLRPVLDIYSPKQKPAPTQLPDCTLPNDPPPSEQAWVCERDRNSSGVEAPRADWTKVLTAPAALTNSDVSSANPTLFGQSGFWEVELHLTSADRFQTVTGQLACAPMGSVKRQLAIVVDGVAVSRPEMGAQVQCGHGINGGVALISGDFNEREAKDLAAELSGRALPTSFTVAVV